MEILAADADHRGGEERGKKIKIATYNIRSGRAGNLESALRALEQMEVDLAILTETKLTDDRHTKFNFGYRVVATKAASHNQKK